MLILSILKKPTSFEKWQTENALFRESGYKIIVYNIDYENLFFLIKYNINRDRNTCNFFEIWGNRICKQQFQPGKQKNLLNKRFQITGEVYLAL